MHLFSRRSAARPAPLLVQQLESRLVPALTYHGGALLHHVDVQNVYLGDGWLGSAFRTGRHKDEPYD